MDHAFNGDNNVGAQTFNDDISAWDTSQVTSMISAFRSAAAFNQNIGSWNTIKVTTMKYVSNESMTCWLLGNFEEKQYFALSSISR
jgi:surface protein